MKKTYRIKYSFIDKDSGAYSGEAGLEVTKEFYDKYSPKYADRLEVTGIIPNFAKSLVELKAELAEIMSLIKDKEKAEKAENSHKPE